MKEFFLACGGAIVGGMFSVLLAILSRKWQKTDKKTEADLAKEKLAADQERRHTEQLNRIEKKLDQHIAENEAEFVVLARSRMLQFADEIRRGAKHSQENFAAINDDINRYDDYCGKNPDFPNSKAEAAKKIIRDTYEKCVLENSFI